MLPWLLWSWFLVKSWILCWWGDGELGANIINEKYYNQKRERCCLDIVMFINGLHLCLESNLGHSYSHWTTIRSFNLFLRFPSNMMQGWSGATTNSLATTTFIGTILGWSTKHPRQSLLQEANIGLPVVRFEESVDDKVERVLELIETVADHVNILWDLEPVHQIEGSHTENVADTEPHKFSLQLVFSASYLRLGLFIQTEQEI